MPRTRPADPLKFPQQMVQLVEAGRTPEEREILKSRSTRSGAGSKLRESVRSSWSRTMPTYPFLAARTG